jgi:hypothetical protein
MSNIADSNLNASSDDKSYKDWIVFAKMHFNNAKDEDGISS